MSIPIQKLTYGPSPKRRYRLKRVRRQAEQQWYPSAQDLDDLAKHCELKREKRRAEGSLGGWTRII